MLTSVFVLVKRTVFGSNSLIIQCLIAVWWIKRSKVLLLIYRLITDLFQEVELTDFKNLYCNVKYFKEIKCLKNLQKAEAYLEPKQASMMELFLWIYLTGAQPEIFQGRGGFVKFGHSEKDFVKNSRKKKPRREKLRSFFS